MVLSLHTDSPLSDLRCCLCFQLSLVSFLLLLPLVRSHFTIPRSRASSIPRFSSFCSLRLYVFSTALLFSLPVQSCSPRCLIPYTVVQPSDVSRDTFTLSFTLSLSPLFFFLCFSLISTLFFLYTLFSRLLFLAAPFFSYFAF